MTKTKYAVVWDLFFSEGYDECFTQWKIHTTHPYVGDRQ